MDRSSKHAFLRCMADPACIGGAPLCLFHHRTRTEPWIFCKEMYRKDAHIYILNRILSQERKIANSELNNFQFQRVRGETQIQTVRRAVEAGLRHSLEISSATGLSIAVASSYLSELARRGEIIPEGWLWFNSNPEIKKKVRTWRMRQ